VPGASPGASSRQQPALPLRGGGGQRCIGRGPSPFASERQRGGQGCRAEVHGGGGRRLLRPPTHPPRRPAGRWRGRRSPAWPGGWASPGPRRPPPAPSTSGPSSARSAAPRSRRRRRCCRCRLRRQPPGALAAAAPTSAQPAALLLPPPPPGLLLLLLAAPARRHPGGLRRLSPPHRPAGHRSDPTCLCAVPGPGLVRRVLLGPPPPRLTPSAPTSPCIPSVAPHGIPNPTHLAAARLPAP
jgi:hypothetical protein